MYIYFLNSFNYCWRLICCYIHIMYTNTQSDKHTVVVIIKYTSSPVPVEVAVSADVSTASDVVIAAWSCRSNCRMNRHRGCSFRPIALRTLLYECRYIDVGVYVGQYKIWYYICVRKKSRITHECSIYIRTLAHKCTWLYMYARMRL